RTSLPSLGGTPASTRSLRSPADECTAEARSWSPGVSGRDFAEETTGSRKFLGNPDCPFAHVQSTPAGLRSPDHYGGAASPLGSQEQRLPRKVFRRSIAWLSDWRSTLRGAGYPRPAQDSLPAAGQALPGGHFTRRVPLKGFRGRFPTSHPPFPSFLPQSDRPKHRRASLRASVSSDRRAQVLGRANARRGWPSSALRCRRTDARKRWFKAAQLGKRGAFLPVFGGGPGFPPPPPHLPSEGINSQNPRIPRRFRRPAITELRKVQTQTNDWVFIGSYSPGAGNCPLSRSETLQFAVNGDGSVADHWPPTDSSASHGRSESSSAAGGQLG